MSDTIELTDEQCQQMRADLMAGYRAEAAAQLGPDASAMTDRDWAELLALPVLTMSQVADLSVDMTRKVLANISPVVAKMKSASDALLALRRHVHGCDACYWHRPCGDGEHLRGAAWEASDALHGGPEAWPTEDKNDAE